MGGGELVLLVGLGNPGPSYAKTRHNLGFRILEEWVRRKGAAFRKKEKWRSLFAEGESEGIRWIALLPQTYMNLSGEAVSACARFSGIDAGKIFVIADDADLPFGQMRLRIHSGPGGHNGLKSIEASLQTNRYVRLKVGIGAPERGEALEDYVLGRFSSEEEEKLPEVVERALLAIELWMEKGVTRAMDAVNRRPPNPSNGEHHE